MDNKLKELRLNKEFNGKIGMTQQEIADEIGVTKRTYIYWEKGERQIKPEKAQQLADYFGVSVAYLLGYSDDPETPFKEYSPTPREFASWREFDYMQLSKTDLDFDVYQTLRKEVDPLLLELILNYSFSEEEERELLRDIAKKFAKNDAVSFLKLDNKK